MGTPDVRTVLVVAGDKFELAHVRSRDGVAFVKVTNGPGPRLALAGIEALRQRVDAVVSAGICGAVAPDLNIGDVVVASEVNGWPAARPRSSRAYRLVRMASADRVIGTVAERRELAARGFDVVDMESSAVLGEAQRLDVPFYCVRAVSDKGTEDWTLDLNAARDENGAFRISSVLRQALARPAKVVPELIRLRRNSSFAARRLGDFFADCDF